MARWLVFFLLLGSVTVVAAPLDKPAFTATPAELLAIAKAVPTTGPAAILRSDIALEVDARGRRTQRKRFIYVVRSRDAVQDWSELFHVWRPFFQDKPTVRARVIGTDGRVVELDPKTLRDEPMVDHGDRRRLLVPLPPLAIGSIVEEEVVLRDREPIVGPIGVDRIVLGDVVSIPSLHVVVSAPVARKLQVSTRNVPGTPRHEVIGTTERWTLDVALPARHQREDHSPGDVDPTALLVVGIAPSWNAVARAVRGVVDKRISEGPVPLPTDLPTTATIETIRAITAWTHRKVAFDGVTLRDSAVVPSTPAATLQRGTGDSKDVATLLITLLRQASIRADLVLIADGPEPDVISTVPGLDGFDHVLVRARIANRDVWIDPDEPLARRAMKEPHPSKKAVEIFQ